MKLSLRQRALFLIAAIQAAVVGVEFALLASDLARSSREAAIQSASDLVSTLRGSILPEGELNAARILEWPGWIRFADALVLDQNLTRGERGEVRPEGVALNPLGSSGRGADFDSASVYAAIQLVLDRGLPLDQVAGGRVVPIDTRRGIWGACWYRIDPDQGRRARLLRYFLLLTLGSTVVLTAGTFLALRKTVLDPVTQLTDAARRVAAGDWTARVDVPEQRDELAELSRTFNAMVDQVRGFNTRLEREVELATGQARRAEAAAMTQRRLAATGELAAGIAHEINNPLGGLLNAVERLKQEPVAPEKRAQYLDLLAGGLERIRLTVGRLLRLTPRQARRAPVALHEPVLDAIALVRHRAVRAGVVIAVSDGVRTSDADPLPEELRLCLVSLPAIRGEAHELGQAVLNLLVNALDALEELPAGERRIDVTLRAETENRRLVIEVQDNGPGVTQSELARVSDLFYTTKEVGKGTGLGLAIVHTVIASHGGTVELDSAPGRGFRVVIRLPFEREDR